MSCYCWIIGRLIYTLYNSYPTIIGNYSIQMCIEICDAYSVLYIVPHTRLLYTATVTVQCTWVLEDYEITTLHYWCNGRNDDHQCNCQSKGGSNEWEDERTPPVDLGFWIVLLFVLVLESLKKILSWMILALYNYSEARKWIAMPDSCSYLSQIMFICTYYIKSMVSIGSKSAHFQVGVSTGS